MSAIGVAPRAVPLAPCAVLALESGLAALARRLLELDDARLSRLRAVYGARFLLIFGERDDLPWAEGVQYLGRDANAPRLLLPTAVEPSVPSSLFERAVAQRCEQAKPPLAPPWAVSLDPERILGIALTQPVARARLAEFLAGTPPPSLTP